MYFLYADESGDTGLINSPTQFFCLSGIIVHELHWHETLEAILDFRRYLKMRYGLKLRDEIHAAHYIHSPGELRRIPKSLRLRLLKETVDFQSTLPDICIMNVMVDKRNKPHGTDIFEIAWSTLLQRFHVTVSYKNFSSHQHADDRGMLVVDRTDEVKLRRLSRRMRHHGPVSSKAGTGSLYGPITTLVEDAVHRDSLHSYFIQLADVNAYFLYQKFHACKYIKAKGAANHFSRLDAVLCTAASKNDPEWIVSR